MGTRVPADDLPSGAVPADDLPDDLGFQSTGGGAALGNPNMLRQGQRGIGLNLDPAAAIGGAGVAGGVLGAVAPELLSGAGKVAGLIPQTRALQPFLEGMGNAVRAGGRPVAAITGAVSGVMGETAGQAVEAMGGGPVISEAARFAGGGVSGETLNIAKNVLQKYALVPALGLASKFKHEGARVLLEKLNYGAKSLSQKEKELVAALEKEIRGGAETEAPMENIGSIMGDKGQQLLNASELQTANALRQAGTVGQAGAYPGTNTELADIGNSLRSTIVTRNKAALNAREAQYTNTEKLRDDIVSRREGSNQFVSDLPEYKTVIDEVKAQLDNANIQTRSPSVQASYQRILSGLTSGEKLPSGKKLVLSGRNLDLKEVLGADKPLSFKALDDARRKLGEAFRGKPAEGYEAISREAAEDLYHKVSNIQKQFAGGDTGPQVKLLDDYASSTQGLEKFSSKFGKKTTALDQYRDDQFATDASTLPAAYFKTRASIQALKELTGNPNQVQSAALAYANRELAGKDANKVREWMGKNSEWLSEVPATRSMVGTYATRLEGAERSLRNAQDFAKEAVKDADMLIGTKLPAQRAVDLIKSGDAELWAKVVPVITRSPQAKTQMVKAVRQVVADQASAKATETLFMRNIRPFLEQSNIASRAEMDTISRQLKAIAEKNIPEAAKLGFMKRIMLNGVAGWTASAMSRTGQKSMAYAIPEQ